MALLKDLTNCSTYSVRGLDNQLIHEMNQLYPNLLARIDGIPNLELGHAVHPWLQAPAKEGLEKAIAARSGHTMTINSAYRTLAGQQLLRFHYERGRCGITAAARPGSSNHNGASAIDIQDAQGWKRYLEAHGWRWIGPFDPVHFDCVRNGIRDIFGVSVRAFQRVWSKARPNDAINDDGDFGPATASRLAYAPAEGFPGVEPGRILRLTEPYQIGNDIGELQLALRKAGVEIPKADKVFGESTDRAIKEFQREHNLDPDGIVGMTTKKALGLV